MNFVTPLVEQTEWNPDRVGLFAGAVMYTQYNRLTRLFFKLFSLTGDTDTSRDYEYTDWDEVERFAIEFAEFADSHREHTSTAGSLSKAVTGLTHQRVVALGLIGIGFILTVYWIYHWGKVHEQRLP